VIDWKKRGRKTVFEIPAHAVCSHACCEQCAGKLHALFRPTDSVHLRAGKAAEALARELRELELEGAILCGEIRGFAGSAESGLASEGMGALREALQSALSTIDRQADELSRIVGQLARLVAEDKLRGCEQEVGAAQRMLREREALTAQQEGLERRWTELERQFGVQRIEFERVTQERDALASVWLAPASLRLIRSQAEAL
jgi:hypothetical protein